MSSATDELRTWAAERVPIVRRQIEKIADNIDAEFERVAKAVDDTLGRGECRAVSMRERDKRPYLNDEQVCSECGCQLGMSSGTFGRTTAPTAEGR